MLMLGRNQIDENISYSHWVKKVLTEKFVIILKKNNIFAVELLILKLLNYERRNKRGKDRTKDRTKS
jgi:hypothetical protein